MDGSHQWVQLVDQIDVAGVTRMIAEHSNLVTLSLPQVGLQLEQGHDTLLNDQQVNLLQHALEQVLGESVQLQISVGQPLEETPAQYRKRKAEERQMEAEANIHEDSKVLNLLSEFDGRVEEIRPVN